MAPDPLMARFREGFAAGIAPFRHAMKISPANMAMSVAQHAGRRLVAVDAYLSSFPVQTERQRAERFF